MQIESTSNDSLLALQASETRYRRLFETAQDGILILNAETGQIDDVNPYMIDMLHYSHTEFLGKQLWEVSPFKDTVVNRAAFEELQNNGYIRYKDLPLETKEGEPVAVEFVSNVYEANGIKVIQCNIRNITERKNAEGRLLKNKNRYRNLSVTDALTKLYNYRHFYHQLKSETERSNRYRQPLTILLLDLDDFKQFNDIHGHIGRPGLTSIGSGAQAMPAPDRFRLSLWRRRIYHPPAHDNMHRWSHHRGKNPGGV